MDQESPLHTILALDIATTCGWAMSKGNEIHSWGVANFQSKSDTIHAPGYRLIDFRNWLIGFGVVDEVIYEQAGGGFQNIAAMETHYAMLGIVRMYCAGAKIPLFHIHNQTLKHKFTGSGRAKKIDMCAFAHRMGWTGGRIGTDQDHDACDACALIVVKQLERDIEMHFAK